MNQNIIKPGTWPKRYHMMWLLLLALLLCYIDRVLISLAAIEMQTELGWSDRDKGFVLSSFFMGYLVMQILGGILSNRYGGRNVFLIAVVLWSVFTILTPVAAYISLAALLLARFMLGIGEGAAYPAAYNLIHGWMRTNERSRSIGAITAASAMGTVFALLVTGVLIERFGWPSVFYLFGSMGLIWSLFWIKQIPPIPETPADITHNKVVSQCVKSNRNIPWKLLLSHPAVLALYCVTACVSGISYTLASWLPSYFVDTFGLTITSAGIYSIVPWGALIVVTIIAGIITDKLIAKGIETIVVRKRLVLIGLLAIVFSMLLLTRVDSADVAAVVVCGVFSGLAVLAPAYAPMVSEVLPDHGDILYGFCTACGSVAGSILVAITGVFLEKTGSYDFLFLGMAAMSVLGLVVFQLFAQASPISNDSDEYLEVSNA